MSEEDRNQVAVDERDDDWGWRRRIRSNPTTRTAYRIAVFVVGLVIVAGGLALVPLPGPGWVLVFVGLAIWASEFEKAQAVLDFAKRQVHRWTDWVQRQALWVRLLVGLLLALFVAAVIWGVFKVSGLPGFLPDSWEQWLHANAGL